MRFLLHPLWKVYYLINLFNIFEKQFIFVPTELLDCQNGKFVTKKSVCNGIDDCGNNIDEVGCPTRKSLTGNAIYS